MTRIRYWSLALFGITASVCAPMETGASRQPVLVELFTSEGCSSCPPADALLERLDRSQPLPGAQVIVLSEHVDYWNHLGWADPYSSPASTARQQEYARRFHTQGPYTPQMVVDGRSEFVGSDARAAESAIRDASRQPKTSIRIADSDGAAAVEVDPLPPSTAQKATVYAAYAADAGTQDVLRGENKGRRLHHVAVVKELKAIGTIDNRTSLKMRLRLESGSRLIVFVQESGKGPVWASAMLAASR
ncbi:MAG TPA: DUF1223 domain-containing protein [Bryobacteraceae bacterium]|nr:DUF1223 domain-containing protein [Bryobacteraceae bacterium]